MSFRPYPEYKPSGVEWLGDIPTHWDVDRFKWSVESARNGIWGAEPAGDENDIACVRVADFDRDHLRVRDLVDPTIRNVTPQERDGRTLRAGDLLLEKSGGGELQPVGFVVLYDQGRPAICSNFVAKLTLAPRMVPSYWRYVHAAAYSVRLNVRSIKQTSGIQNLDQGQYLDERAPFPPVDEQRTIAAFLDRETARIDALVDEQQRLIELLQEKRQAVISHAVTKGLDPAARMKDSGVEWLGEIPAHWSVEKMKWVATMESGHTPDKKIAAYWDGNIPWVSLNDTGYLKDHDYVSETAHNITQAGIDNSSAKLLPPGAVVFSRDATIGRCAITKVPLAVSQHFIAWLCGERIRPEYLLLRLRSMTDELERLTTGATVKTIGMPEVRTLITPVPPLSEQDEIVSWVAGQCRTIDALLSDGQRAVQLLQERRTALISAAVTGKVDVRTQATWDFAAPPN